MWLMEAQPGTPCGRGGFFGWWAYDITYFCDISLKP